jgi:hypothetical protein
MGLEAARVGIPVLSWTSNMYYVDDDFIQATATREEYRRRLDALPWLKYSWSMLTKSVRFYHWRTFALCLDMRETVRIHPEFSNSWPAPPASMVKPIYDILDGRRDVAAYYREQWIKNLPDDAAQQEVESNLKGIRLYLSSLFFPEEKQAAESHVEKPVSFFIRLCRKIAYHCCDIMPVWLLPPDPPPGPNFVPPTVDDYILEFCDNPALLEKQLERTTADASLGVLVREDENYITCVRHGRAIRRMSPLAVRLGRLCAETGE